MTITVGLLTDNYESLYGLKVELRQLAGKNVLEVLEVNVEVYAYSQFRASSGPWALGLDRLLTNFGAFPALRRVAVGFAPGRDMSRFRFPKPVRACNHYPWQLTEAQFPRLLASPAINFMLGKFVLY